MARRRKLETPSAEALSKIEEDFKSETVSRSGIAPIAQVAAEAALETEVLGVETRAKLAEADVFRDAQDKGLVIRELPLEQIQDHALVRDRAIVDRDELAALRASIMKNGLRLPIEVFPLETPEGPHLYGLISGYRRLVAMREIYQGTELEDYRMIKAIIRIPETHVETVEAMVEENEVRAELSQFERGRIAVLAAQAGTYGNVEEAVDGLFPFASRAKRSKIRSFSLIFQELGDLLNFPDQLSERQGLRLSAALREGAEGRIRQSLGMADPQDSEAEWAVLLPIIEAFETSDRDRARGGRPAPTRKKPGPKQRHALETSCGVTIEWEPMRGGYAVKLKGALDAREMQDLAEVLKERLLYLRGKL